jgi:hypothetical protein
MRSEDRMADLFRRYEAAIKNGTEDEALRIRKQIQTEREIQDRK